MKISKIIESINPFSVDSKTKNEIFLDKIKSLTLHHYNNCKIYKKIIRNFKFKITTENKLENFPMLPVKIFKNFDLISVPKNKIKKKLVSSGTSGQLSKIYLDKQNANNQTRVLKKIMSTNFGNERLPMLIIDQNPRILDRSVFSARATAIYGFSIFGKNHSFLLNEKGEINYNSLNDFLHKYGNKSFFIFGFTSIVYENLVQKLNNKLINHNFKNGILLHGGGWKKMEKLKVSNKNFKQKLFKKIKLRKIYNYYGLVEQTGSIFLECYKCGYFVTSIFSDIIIRDKKFKILKKGQKGLVQLLSLLPTSYPGHNILTEDVGEIIGEDNCKCGLKGKYFVLHGRAKEAEVRGCSDVR